MSRWLTSFVLTFGLATLGWGQVQPPLMTNWLSFVLDNNNLPTPIRLDPNTGLPDPNGVLVDSRFPSVSAGGNGVVFQVGRGQDAWIWERQMGQPQATPVLDPQTGQPIRAVYPVISADGNHLAFASWQDYRLTDPSNPPFPNPPKSQIYVLDRLQNRIVPISFLWQDTDNDSVRDTFAPSLGNCVPVAISANGRIVVFLAQSPDALNIVDEEGDGVADNVPNPPQGWLILVHDRDADGNGIYDETGIGATRTSIESVDTNGNLLLAVSVTVSANGRTIAFATPADPSNPDENWRIFVRDWQSGTGDFIRDVNNNPVLAFAPALSDDGSYLAYLAPRQLDNDGDGQLNEDPIDGTDNDNDGQVDEDPVDHYPQTAMDLIVLQLIDPATGQPPSQIRELSLSGLQLPPQAGTADGSAGWGYSDWWGAVTIATDPNNPRIVYVAFHAWATDLIDLQLVRNDLLIDPNNQTDRLRFYQGAPNIFLARFDFTLNAQNPVQLWRFNAWTNQQQRGLPVSLLVVSGQQLQYRLVLSPSMLPAVSFVNGNQLAIAFQSLAGFDSGDTNGLWDIYLATVILP